MKLGEGVRWWLALAGPIFLEAASFMPIFGAGAKYRYRCGGRELTDECFSDYLPIVEMILPLITILLLYPFAKLAFTLFAPDPERRTLRWRLASDTGVEDLFPTLHIFPVLGAVWAIWRAATYPLAPVMWPYLLFWILFAGWFVLGLIMAWKRPEQ